MSDKGKRVSDLAKEWGISPNGVKYRLKKAFPDQSEWIREEDGSILISPDQETKIVEMYGHELAQEDLQDEERALLQVQVEEQAKKIEEMEARYKSLQELFDSERIDARKREERLDKEMQEKNEQIRKLEDIAERAQQSLAAEQVLHKEALALIPAKHEDSQDAEIIEHEDVTTVNETKPPEEKKGFWAKLFGLD